MAKKAELPRTFLVENVGQFRPGLLFAGLGLGFALEVLKQGYAVTLAARRSPVANPKEVPRQPDTRNERHSHSRDTGKGTGERDARELCRAANRRLRTPEHAPIATMKYRKMKPASSIAKALIRPFHLLSCAQFVHSWSPAVWSGVLPPLVNQPMTKSGANATPDRARSRCHGGETASVAASGLCGVEAD